MRRKWAIVLTVLTVMALPITACFWYTCSEGCHCSGVNVTERPIRNRGSILDNFGRSARAPSASLVIDVEGAQPGCLLSYLRNHPRRIVSIDMSGGEINSEWAALFEMGKNTIELNIVASRITGEYEVGIFSDKQYHAVSLRVRSICQSFATALSQVRRIDRLRISGLEGTDSIERLVTVGNVGTIEVVGMRIDDNLLHAICLNSGIEVLSFEQCRVGEAELKRLSEARPEVVIKHQGEEQKGKR